MLQWNEAPPRGARVSMIAAAALLALALATPSRAAEEPKSERSNGKLVSYDAGAQTIVVKEGGEQQTHQVKTEGSVLTRTTVTMNGKVANFDDVKPA